MATQGQNLTNEDLDELNIHLSQLKLSLDVAPSRRSQKKKRKGAQTSITALADTKDEIINKIKEDLGNIRQLYEKLKKIRESDADCTEEDVDQVTSLLKSFIREIEPDHPFVTETEESLADDEAVDGPADVSAEGSGNQPRRHRKLVFTNYNEDDMMDAAWNGLEDGEDTGQRDDEARDPDYQDEVMGDGDDDDDYEEEL
ncbi:hypothetical protein FAGAP_5831 [Fusarium agapanthi]|uniref:Uncharacterized protein n=1 Tax=Fusarium agapanthi TaxID=1803897 RepID=A0A9P5B9P7_9HYPO|nr:hypothetical protein FAGAP_5831 [Fusarium agapanthi]